MSTRALLEHSRDTGEVVMVDVVELTHTLAGSCDLGCDWDMSGGEKWLANLILTKVEDHCIGYLIDSLLRYGFVVPLNVIWNYNNEYATDFVMGNGNHRLIAALLCGFGHIPVVVSHTTLDFCHTESDSHGYSWAEERGYYEAVEPGLASVMDVCLDVISER